MSNAWDLLDSTRAGWRVFQAQNAGFPLFRDEGSAYKARTSTNTSNSSTIGRQCSKCSGNAQNRPHCTLSNCTELASDNGDMQSSSQTKSNRPLLSRRSRDAIETKTNSFCTICGRAMCEYSLMVKLPTDIKAKILGFGELREICTFRRLSREFAQSGHNTLHRLEKLSREAFMVQDQMLRTVIRHCFNLREISVWANASGTETHVALLRKCPKLEKINCISAEVLQEFDGTLPALRSIHTRIGSTAEMHALAHKCRNLAHIELERTVYHDSSITILPVLRSCTNLEVMTVWGFDLDPEALRAFQHVPNLQELLLYAADMTDDHCEILAKHANPRLRRLKLSGLLITSAGLGSLAEYQTQLQELNVSFTSIGHDIAHFLNNKTHFPALRQLKVRWGFADEIRSKIQDAKPLCRVSS